MAEAEETDGALLARTDIESELESGWGYEHARDGLADFEAAVRAEAVAGERQRIAELVTAALVPDDVDEWSDNNEGWNRALGRVLRDLRAAAGSVPVATPEPPARCGQKRSQSSAGAYWLNAEQYDSVALCCDEPAGHVGDHRCNEGKPGHDIWPNHEPCAAEPSVGTGTPAEATPGGSEHAERQEPAGPAVAASTVQALLEQERRNAAAVLESVVAEWRQACHAERAWAMSLTAEVARLTGALAVSEAERVEVFTEAASCRAAIENLRAELQAPPPVHSEPVQMGIRKRLDDILAAALGDGE